MRVMLLFHSDWSHEIARYHAGEAASHRLHGMVELEALGHEVVRNSAPRGGGGLRFRLWQALWAMLHQRRIDVLYATHESAALPVLLLRRLGLLRRPVIVPALSLLLPNSRRGIRRWLWRRLLPAADAVLAVFTAQIDRLIEVYGVRRDRVHFVPVGTDTDFFAPRDGAVEARTVLAAGTQQGRDLVTLAKAMPAGSRLRLIVTPELAAQVAGQVGAGVELEILAPMLMPALREQYARAAVHVCPLEETAFGSSHTVLLENMAMGKVMIVSDVSGMRDYVQDGENARVVAPGDVEGLRDAIVDVLGNPEHYREMAERAARDARERFSIKRTVGAWLEISQRLLGGD